MSNKIKVKSYTIEQDGVEIELVVGEKYQFRDGNKPWSSGNTTFDGIQNGQIVSSTGNWWDQVREIKAPEMRPCTTLESIEKLSVLSRTKVVLASFGLSIWTPWSRWNYENPENYKYCILENGKLGEPMKLEIEV